MLFSGFFGGTADIANQILKETYPEQYALEIDDFSRAITAGFLSDLQKKFDDTGNGYLNSSEMQESAQSVWNDQGLQGEFPGNFVIAIDKLILLKFGESYANFSTVGTWTTIKSSFLELLTFGQYSDGSPIREEDLDQKILYDNNFQVKTVTSGGVSYNYVIDNDGRVVDILSDVNNANGVGNFKYLKSLYCSI